VSFEENGERKSLETEKDNHGTPEYQMPYKPETTQDVRHGLMIHARGEEKYRWAAGIVLA